METLASPSRIAPSTFSVRWKLSRKSSLLGPHHRRFHVGSGCCNTPPPRRSCPMADTDAEVRKLLRQQAAVAGFGSFALRQTDLLKVLNEAARVCAEGLGVPYCKVCRYRPDENDLLIVAGHGWHAGVVGHVVSRADASSPQGRAFTTGEPSICNDLRTD